MNKLVLLLAMAASLVSAQDTNNNYTVYKETSSAAEKITIQQPSSPQVTVVGQTANVYSSVACNASVIQLGSAATTTTLAITALNGGVASQVNAYSASDSSGGTTLNTAAIAAGGTIQFDLSKMYLSRGAGINLSIATDCTTGTVRIFIAWQEKQ